MSKHVLSSLRRTLGPSGDDGREVIAPGGDDGSEVICDEHLRKLRFLTDAKDRIFDARLFPGGDSFECERCLDARDQVNQGEWEYGHDGRYPRVDRWKDRRLRRSEQLYRLTIAHQVRRFTDIMERLAEFVMLLVVLLLLKRTENALTPYLGDSWIREVGLAIVLLLVDRVGVRLLLYGKLSRTPLPATAPAGS